MDSYKYILTWTPRLQTNYFSPSKKFILTSSSLVGLVATESHAG